MIYQDLPSIQKSLKSFLNQRDRAYGILYTHSKDPELLIKKAMISRIRNQWAMIQNMDYWRHCREVILRESVLLEILPSGNGKHAKIRTHVLQMIEHCRAIQKIPRHIYLSRKETVLTQ